MNNINLNRIIEEKNLDVKALAQELFPTVKFPKLALNRILSGEAFLDTNQLSKLSFITGIPISELFESGDWETSLGTAGLHHFTNGKYKATLDTTTWVTKIYMNDSLFHDAVIHDRTVALSVYLADLTNLINKYDEQVK